MNDEPVAGVPRKLGLRRIGAVPTTAMPVRSAATKSEATKSAATKSEAEEPEAEEPVTGESDTAPPATEKPDVEKPVEKPEKPAVERTPAGARSVAVAAPPQAPPPWPKAGQAPPPWPPVVRPNLQPSWPGPQEPASRPVLYAGAAAGIAAAAMLPVGVPGIGWVLTGVVGVAAVFTVTRRRSPLSIAWAVAALVLLAVPALLRADWLFALCLMAASAAGSFAVTDGKTLRGVVFGAFAVPAAAFRSVPWVVRGLKAVRPARRDKALGRTILISLGLLLVFVPLLAGADAAFADLLGNLVPDLNGVSPFRWGFLFVVIGLGTVGACYVQAAPPPLDGKPRDPRTVSRREWAVPIGLLVAVFAVFVGVQLASLFGGDDYVQRTAELTYAQYARNGFWQLLAVTVLTLVVIGVATRFAAAETASDRLWLRSLLGGLAGLTLVIVASALSRMWAYQQAYGFTTLRLLVFSCEVWLAVVYLLVIAAGVKLRAGWLPRSLAATATATLLVLAALNPDRFVADHNVERWQATGKIDVPYLGTLSVDAVPAFDALPPEVRTCLLVRMKDRLGNAEGWQFWNLSREQARPALDQVSSAHACDFQRTTTR
ncbi:MAG: DUF4173 domain-containing protein [Umezawaea sp.]